jgi:hypothetical protein
LKRRKEGTFDISIEHRLLNDRNKEKTVNATKALELPIKR